MIDVINELKKNHAEVDVYDPWVDPDLAEEEYGIRPVGELGEGAYDAIVLAVAHRQFRDMSIDTIRNLGKDVSVIFDIKHVLPANKVDGRL